MTHVRKGNPNFYPGFCNNNPVSVFLFYIFDDANEADNADENAHGDDVYDDGCAR